MSDDFVPPPMPEPSGALVPPDRLPPTAVGTATPEPPRPSLPSANRMATEPEFMRVIRRAVDAALDVADDLADLLAGAIDSVRAAAKRGPGDVGGAGGAGGTRP